MIQETRIGLPFSSLSGRHLQADFDGGALSSDGGVLFFVKLRPKSASFAALQERSMTVVMPVIQITAIYRLQL